MLDMSTATIHQLPDHDLHAVDKTINRTIRALMADREMHPDAFRAQTGLPSSTYYNRMKLRGHWQVVEIVRAAEVLGVPVQTLVNGLGLPHLDSNQKPADYQTPSTAPDPVSPSGRGQVTERHLWVA